MNASEAYAAAAAQRQMTPRFALLRQAIERALEDLLADHPDLFADTSDDDARALGREAADRAVAALLKQRIPNL